MERAMDHKSRRSIKETDKAREHWHKKKGIDIENVSLSYSYLIFFTLFAFAPFLFIQLSLRLPLSLISPYLLSSTSKRGWNRRSYSSFIMNEGQFNDSVHQETPFTTQLHLLHLLAWAQASEHGLMMSPLALKGPQISPTPMFALIIHMINASIQLIDN